MKGFQYNLDAAAVGLEMGGCVAVGYLIGAWVDSAHGTAPWGMLFFMLCGIGAAAKGLMRVVRKTQRQLAANEEQDEE